MAWLLGAAGGAGAAGAGAGASGLAAEAGAAGAAGAGAGTVADATLGGTTPPTPATTSTTGGLLDWWNGQPPWARDVLQNQAMSSGGNLLSPTRPGLPSAAGMPPPPSPISMTQPSPMTGQPGQPADMSAMAPFIQALARRQGADRVGASPYGFGVPSAYFS